MQSFLHIFIKILELFRKKKEKEKREKTHISCVTVIYLEYILSRPYNIKPKKHWSKNIRPALS